MLVDFNFALHGQHLQLETDDTRQHFVLVVHAQINPLLLKGWFVVANQFFKFNNTFQ